ncbi:MAG: hypothetical protein Kow0042_24170 [Calditrichia bacterium]
MSGFQYKDMNFEQALRTIRNCLHSYKPVRLTVNGARQASVLILLTEKAMIPHLLFTRRTEFVEHHKGQISFPGGMKDSTDETLLQTALRETYEEVGISPEKVEVLGQLDDLYTVTNFLVTPFAAVLKQSVPFRVNSREVDEVLEVPLSLFLDDKYFEMKKREYQGRKYDVYFYYYRDQVIWGATAFILNRFIQLVFGYNPAPNPVYQDPRNEEYLRENQVRGSKRD